MTLEKTKKFGVILTKGESRDKNRHLGNILINKYGLSVAFSRRMEDGSYESAAKVVYPSGHEEPIGVFNNIYVSTDDQGLVDYASSCLENSYKRNLDRQSDSGNGDKFGGI